MMPQSMRSQLLAVAETIYYIYYRSSLLYSVTLLGNVEDRAPSAWKGPSEGVVWPLEMGCNLTPRVATDSHLAGVALIHELRSVQR